MERRGQPVRASTPLSRFTSPAQPQSQNNQRGRTSPRPRNDNAGYQRDQFEDQQLQRFDDAPPQNYLPSLQPGRFQPSTNLRCRRGAALIHVSKEHHRGGPTLAQGMVALSLPLLLRWAVAAGQTTGPRETVPRVRQQATGLHHPFSARSPSRTTPTVQSTAHFKPDLDWDAGRTTDFDGHCR